MENSDEDNESMENESIENESKETQESTSLAESPSTNKYIDDLTMKLLTNQTTYAKYVTKNGELAQEEKVQFHEDCQTWKTNILSITRKLCNQDGDHQYGSDITESFDVYVRNLVRYLETKKRSDELQKEYDEEMQQDEEEMFPYEIDEQTQPSADTYKKMSTLDNFLKKTYR